jgi:hypothetical protein
MPRMKEVWTPLKLVGIRYFKDRDNKVYYKKVGKGHRYETRPFWKYKRFGIVTVMVLLTIPGYIGYAMVMDKASEKIMKEVTGQVSKEEVSQLLKDPTVQEMMEKELGTEKTAEVLKNYEVEASGIVTARISEEDLTFKKNEQPSVPEKMQESQNQGGQSSDPKGTSERLNKDISGSNNQKPQNGNNEQTNQPKEATQNTKKEPQGLKFESREEATKFVMSKFSMSEISSFTQMAQGGLTAEEKEEIKSTVKSRLTNQEYEALKVFGLIEMSKQQ